MALLDWMQSKGVQAPGAFPWVLRPGSFETLGTSVSFGGRRPFHKGEPEVASKSYWLLNHAAAAKADVVTATRLVFLTKLTD
jgi:hypothetical protein